MRDHRGNGITYLPPSGGIVRPPIVRPPIAPPGKIVDPVRPPGIVVDPCRACKNVYHPPHHNHRWGQGLAFTTAAGIATADVCSEYAYEKRMRFLPGLGMRQTTVKVCIAS